MKKVIIAIVVAGIIAAGTYAVVGRGGGGAVLGKEIPAGMEAVTVSQALEQAKKQPGSEVVINGTMEEKCPSAGCWFYLSDDTGRIRVDTQFAGFNVLDQKSGSQVTVYGKLVQHDDGEAEVAALGAEFE